MVNIMFPSFYFLGKEISMYALMAVIGLLVAGFVFCRRISKAGYDDNEAIFFLLTLSLGMLVGGSTMYFITNAKYWYMLTQSSSFAELLTTLGKLFGGSVFYGGLIGAYIIGLIYVKVRSLPKALYMDSAALFAPIFHIFGRLGCFFGGCCYGIECKFGFAARGNEITAIGEATRFPVQLLESFCNLCIALIILAVLKKQRLAGRVFYLYLIMYSTVRFFDEFLRGDEVRGFVFALSTSQFISIFIFLFASVSLIPSFKKRKALRV